MSPFLDCRSNQMIDSSPFLISIKQILFLFTSCKMLCISSVVFALLAVTANISADAAAGGTKDPWWRTTSIYQIYPRSFQDSDGDGIGDIPGITSRLDYLSGLGAGALWLSPIFKSPMKDFGYDISDFTDVDPIFGTLDDFREMVNHAHDLG